MKRSSAPDSSQKTADLRSDIIFFLCGLVTSSLRPSPVPFLHQTTSTHVMLVSTSHVSSLPLFFFIVSPPSLLLSFPSLFPPLLSLCPPFSLLPHCKSVHTSSPCSNLPRLHRSFVHPPPLLLLLSLSLVPLPLLLFFLYCAPPQPPP